MTPGKGSSSSGSLQILKILLISLAELFRPALVRGDGKGGPGYFRSNARAVRLSANPKEELLVSPQSLDKEWMKANSAKPTYVGL